MLHDRCGRTGDETLVGEFRLDALQEAARLDEFAAHTLEFRRCIDLSLQRKVDGALLADGAGHRQMIAAYRNRDFFCTELLPKRVQFEGEPPCGLLVHRLNQVGDEFRRRDVIIGAQGSSGSDQFTLVVDVGRNLL